MTTKSQFSLFHTPIPGEFISGTVDPGKMSAFVVKLHSGERVQLLGQSNSASSKLSEPKTKSKCRRIKTIRQSVELPSIGHEEQTKKLNTDVTQDKAASGVSKSSPKNSVSSSDYKTPSTTPRDTRESSQKSNSGQSSLASDSKFLSPRANSSYSPPEVEVKLQINYTLSEIVQSEYVFVKSLQLLGNFYIDPLLLKCSGHRITCTPLQNIANIINQLRERHEKFLACVSKERDIGVHAENITQLFLGSTYGAYSACVELLRALASRQIFPFESAYVKNLQKFLERNQPGEQRMDLSFSSLLQKPMGRIAKYRLFLASLSKLSPQNKQVRDAVGVVNGRLLGINQQIYGNKKKEAILAHWASILDYSSVGVKTVFFFGAINLSVTCVLQWMEFDRRRSFDIVSRECQVMVHDYHVVICDAKVPKLLFVLPFRACQFLSDATSWVGGLYNDDACTAKLIFERNHCQYEFLVKSSSVAAHGDFLKACERIPTDALKYVSREDLDCLVVPVLAQFDINVDVSEMVQEKKTSCYFRQMYHVNQHRPSSRTNIVGRIFRRNGFRNY